MNVWVEDCVLSDPELYRAGAIGAFFDTFTAGDDVFEGISPVSLESRFCQWIRARGPYVPTLSFLRRSPAGQTEPHFIHHDAMMGDWTAILFLNEQPHLGDGTVFWEHKSGRRSGALHDVVDVDDSSQFTERFRVKAQFNRAMIFPSAWFHSRALFQNYGSGDDARLIQIAFGKVA